LEPPSGTRTLEGLRGNLKVGVLYLEAWLRGDGAVGINNLMEDLATAEISRSQSNFLIFLNSYKIVQQWQRHGVSLLDGTIVTRQFVGKLLEEEVQEIKKSNKNKSVDQAAAIFRKLLLEQSPEEMGDFMSLVAYPYLANTNPSAKL
jgi:malate synthase